MFDLIFNGMAAFQQVVMLGTALILLGLGGLLMWDTIRSFFNAYRVDGTVIGVRQKGDVFYAVYRYTLPTGQTIETTADSGSNILQGKATGTLVPLLVSRDDPAKARPVRNYAEPVIAIFFIVPGLILGWYGFKMHPITPMTGVVAIGLIGYAAVRFQKNIIPKDKRLPSIAAWKESRRVARQKELEAMPVRTLESVMNSPEMIAQKEKMVKNNRIAAPIVLLFAGLLLFFGYKQYTKAVELEQHGLSAPGTVIELISVSDSDGTTYKPRVNFTDAKGESFTFESSTSSNPPMYDTGEKVKVLYLAGDPQKSAMIDHGIWNKLFPFVLLGFGVLLVILAVKIVA